MTNAEKNAIIIAARIAAFKAKMDSSEGTWHRDDVLFMLCFLLVIGAGDNIAKNFYPYTFGVKKIKNGIEITLDDKKFRLRNDDLDTILPSDNQGLDRKPYWLEWFDRYEDGQYIVNAAEGAFIALWHRAYFNSTTDRGFVIMRQLLQGLEDLGGKSTQNHLDNLMAWYDKYYTKIKEAFPAMLVNEDMMRYERARVAQLSGTKGTYSEVNPLRQELGDHMITDRGWMKKRLVYIMSMSSYGDFAHDASSGTIVFRLNGNATFDLTPSITMYPTVTAGQTPIRGARTMAGAVCQIMASGTDLDSMINGADYLTDIGEWYNKPIRNNLTVNARMLKELILGTDDDTKIQNMAITISALTVGTCPSLRVLDVRNISTLTGEVSLANCRLLDAVYAEGTSLTNISLADGCPITTLQYPSTNQYITLRGLPLLTTSGINYMNCATSITQFLVSNCPNVNAIQMLGSIIDAQSTQTLTRVYVDGFDETYDNDHILDVLLKLVNGYQAIDINGYDIPGKPILSGTITIDANISHTKYDTLMAAFGANGLVINANGFFLNFEDSRVWEICAYNWGETYDLKEVNGEGGVVDAGTLEANGDTLVYSDHVFCSSQAISAHSGIPATAASAHRYRIEITVEGGRALDGVNAPWDIATASAVGNAIFYPVQYSSAMAAVALGTITAENWADSAFWAEQTILQNGSEAGKYIATVTTTTAAQYLRLGIRAVAGTIVNWKIVSVGVTKMPSGITKEQCAAVTSLSNKFKQNTLITRFPELIHFTSMTNLSAGTGFGGCTNLTYVNCKNITVLGGGTGTYDKNFYGTSIESVYMPSLVSIGQYALQSGPSYATAGQSKFHNPAVYVLGESFSTFSHRFAFLYVYRKKIIILATVPPSGQVLENVGSWYTEIYVPDASYDAYYDAPVFANRKSQLKRLSEYTGERFWEN